MSALARPPAPPRPDELEALMREARERQRRRRVAVATVVSSAAATALVVWAAVPARFHAREARGPGASLVSARRCPPGNLGTIAFVRRGALDVLDLNGCRVRMLVPARVRAPIAMSADGRWVSFTGGYVSARGGEVHRVPGQASWSPVGDSLAVVTKGGGLETGRAGRPLRRLLPEGWGAWTVVFSPGGRRLAVSRTVGSARVEQIWLLNLATGVRRELFREPRREGAPALLEGFSPDGRWVLFWKDLDASGSLLADGVPLLAVPVAGGGVRTVARGELYFRDFLGWCGRSLVYVTDHGGRTVTDGDGIAETGPPGWRSRTILQSGGPLSWTSFACGPRQTLAVAAGRSSEDEPFGHEHRSIWLVRGGKASLLEATRPPRGRTDEWPSWSADGRWLLFVRTRWSRGRWPGTLYALDLANDRLVGPIARVGATENYYGHYAWSSQVSWHRP